MNNIIRPLFKVLNNSTECHFLVPGKEATLIGSDLPLVLISLLTHLLQWHFAHSEDGMPGLDGFTCQEIIAIEG